MTLIWSKKALYDLEKIGFFIARDNPERARRYLKTLVERAKGVAHFPKSGGVVPEFRDPQLREKFQDNYGIVYRTNAKEKTICILTIFESHRLLKCKK